MSSVSLAVRSRPSMDASPDAAPDPLVDLSARVMQSDRAAFKALFHRLHEPLVRYAVPRCGDTAAARDVVQEAFLRLWEQRTTLTPGGSVKALLYTIVRNLALNERRNRTTRAERISERMRPAATAPAGADRLDADQLQQRLRRWMDDLPDRQREALLLTRYEGLSHEEVAAIMGVSPRTVNNHIVRGLQTLRTRLQSFDATLVPSDTSSS